MSTSQDYSDSILLSTWTKLWTIFEVLNLEIEAIVLVILGSRSVMLAFDFIAYLTLYLAIESWG